MTPKPKTAKPKSGVRCKPRFRITRGEDIALGPGKIDLLEAIERNGSISSAARDIGLSYKRAWDMVATMNACFKSPLVVSEKGGSGGGGARLTELGHKVAGLYRDMETKAQQAVQADWQVIKKQIKG